MLPSWIKSKNNIPLPTYFLAIDTTKRKLLEIKMFLASSSPSSIRFAISGSSSGFKSGTRPISFKYILTGSFNCTLPPVEKDVKSKRLDKGFSSSSSRSGSLPSTSSSSTSSTSSSSKSKSSSSVAVSSSMSSSSTI